MNQTRNQSSGQQANQEKFRYRGLLILLMVLAALLFIIIVVLCAVAKQHFEPAKPHFEGKQWENYRLSNTTLPEHYHLTLQPFINEGRFEGKVSILIKVLEPTAWIYLHIYNLGIRETKLFATGKRNEKIKELKIARAFEHKENEYWVVHLAKPLVVANYILDLSFNGSLTKNIYGFYRSVYKDEITNQTRMLAATKFEPTYARRAFPCFDEPNKKARYSVKIVHNATEHPTVLSNMPQTDSRRRSDGWTVTSFLPSIPMSTYLVCFIISDFTYLEKKTRNGVTLRTYAPSDRVMRTNFALEVATKALDYYDDYFGIPYNNSISKLDMVSVPDFVSGAMENWGIITYREVYMLFTEGQDSAKQQERIAYAVLHELAHMWFGNVVTMEWWDDLWLNEGFATWFGFTIGMKAIDMEYYGDGQFVSDRLHSVMIKDSVSSSHPIVTPMWHPDNISGAFDSITYTKGAAVIRMLESYLGADVFKRGIQKYMRDFQYRNAKTDQLWQVLSEVSGQNVKKLMDSWIHQTGYPVITYDRPSNVLYQKRFHSNPEEAESTIIENSFALDWFVPITWKDSNGKSGQLMLKPEPDQNKRYKKPSGMSEYSQWIKFNPDQTGYYHVNYDNGLWHTITRQLLMDHTVFSITDRAQLINDAFQLAESETIDYNIPFGLIQYLKNEQNYGPWNAASRNLRYIGKMLTASAPMTNARFEKFVASIVKPVLNDLDWDDSSDKNDKKKMRNVIIELSCRVGIEFCLANATEKFEKWLMDESFRISANYRSAVFSYGMERSATYEVWSKVFERYLRAEPENQRDFQRALARPTVPWLLKLYILYAENTTLIREQDYFNVMQYIGQNPVGKPIAYSYIKDNWEKLVDRFTLNNRYFGRMLPNIVSGSNTERDLEEVENFFNKYPEAGAGVRPRNEALSSIKKNIKWVQKNVNVLDTWLKDSGY